MNSNQAPIVIKLGGAILDNQEAMAEFLQAIHQYKISSQRNLIIVHGGGIVVDQLLDKLNLVSRKIDGLRVTPQEHMEIIVAALAGIANKKLVAVASKLGLNPVGFSLADGNIVTAEIFDHKLGMVGQVTPKQDKLLTLLLQNDFLPIISSIAVDKDGQLLNINADEAATVLAFLLNANLYLLSDVDGVYADNNLLSRLTKQEIEQLIQQDIISGGMIVKVNTALKAAEYLKRAVTIASWRNPQELIGLLENRLNIGTTIVS